MSKYCSSDSWDYINGKQEEVENRVIWKKIRMPLKRLKGCRARHLLPGTISMLFRVVLGGHDFSKSDPAEDGAELEAALQRAGPACQCFSLSSCPTYFGDATYHTWGDSWLWCTPTTFYTYSTLSFSLLPYIRKASLKCWGLLQHLVLAADIIILPRELLNTQTPGGCTLALDCPCLHI